MLFWLKNVFSISHDTDRIIYGELNTIYVVTLHAKILTFFGVCVPGLADFNCNQEIKGQNRQSLASQASPAKITIKSGIECVCRKKAVIILTEEEENFPSCRINSLHCCQWATKYDVIIIVKLEKHINYANYCGLEAYVSQPKQRN